VEFYFLAVEAHPGALHGHPAVFFAFALKVCKKCYCDPKKFFLEKYLNGYKKTQNFMLISNSLMLAFRNLKAKNHEKMHKN
jgi:hypothetical protein